MKFLQIRKRKMKFPLGTGLCGPPAAATAHADAWPRQGRGARVPTRRGERGPMRHGRERPRRAGGGPASRPTRPRQGGSGTFH